MVISVSLDTFSNKLLVHFWVTGCWQSDDKLLFVSLVYMYSVQKTVGRRASLGCYGVSRSYVMRT